MTDFEIYTLDQAVKTAKLSLPHAVFRRYRGEEWRLCGCREDYTSAFDLLLAFFDSKHTLDDFVIEIDVGQDQPSCVYAK